MPVCMPSRADVGVDEVPDAEVAQLADELARRASPCPRASPRPRPSPSRASMPATTASPKRATRLAHELRVGHELGAEHHALDARVGEPRASSRACGCRRRPRTGHAAPRARCARPRRCCRARRRARRRGRRRGSTRRPASTQLPRLVDRVLVVDGDARRSRPARGARPCPPRMSIAGKTITRAAPSDDAAEVGEQLQPHRRGLLGVELHREDVVRVCTAAANAHAVLASSR